MRESIGRRQFIKGSALAVAAAGTGCVVVPRGPETPAPDTDAARAALAEISSEEMPLIASAPVLQNGAETSIGVSFAVSADASGWVEYSTSPDLKDATKVFSGEHGLMTVDD